MWAWNEHGDRRHTETRTTIHQTTVREALQGEKNPYFCSCEHQLFLL